MRKTKLYLEFKLGRLEWHISKSNLDPEYFPSNGFMIAERKPKHDEDAINSARDVGVNNIKGVGTKDLFEFLYGKSWAINKITGL